MQSERQRAKENALIKFGLVDRLPNGPSFLSHNLFITKVRLLLKSLAPTPPLGPNSEQVDLDPGFSPAGSPTPGSRSPVSLSPVNSSPISQLSRAHPPSSPAESFHSPSTSSILLSSPPPLSSPTSTDHPSNSSSATSFEHRPSNIRTRPFDSEIRAPYSQHCMFWHSPSSGHQLSFDNKSLLYIFLD